MSAGEKPAPRRPYVPPEEVTRVCRSSVLEDRCSGCAECAEVCPVSACVEGVVEDEMRRVHPVGTERCGILRGMVDLWRLGPL